MIKKGENENHEAMQALMSDDEQINENEKQIRCGKKMVMWSFISNTKADEWSLSNGLKFGLGVCYQYGLISPQEPHNLPCLPTKTPCLELHSWNA